MLELKQIPEQAIPAALEKALRYRLLNEPSEAESICRDILVADPDNQDALIMLLLALTDEFERDFVSALDQAKQVLKQISGDYEQAYYEGIINERWGKAQFARGMPSEMAVGWWRAAMRFFEKAERLSQPDEPDAMLRWNTCARLVAQHEGQLSSTQSVAHDIQAEFGDDMPPR